MNRTSRVILGGVILAFGASAWAAHHEGGNAAVAEGWIKASHKGKAETRAMVEKHMAANGVSDQGRYVGFGFTLEPQNDDQVVVATVTPGTPAAAVLEPGDVFVSVGDVPATRENRDRLSFRGKPGEPVKAVIRRGDSTMPIEVRRGVIDAQLSKSELLATIDRADAETWPVQKGRVIEVISEGNVVYVMHEIEDTEDDTGYPFVNRIVSRFEFDDAGQVVRLWGLGESRFVLEQQGYTISR